VDQLTPEVTTSKYLGIITHNLRRSCQLNTTKIMEGSAYAQMGNNNRKRLAYTALMRQKFEYGAVCWDPYREGHISALKRVQKRAAKFSNNINEWGWENLARLGLIARICAFFKAYNGGRAWKAIGNRLIKPCYLINEDHNRKIRTRKQKTDVGKYSFVNRTIES